MKCYDTVTFHLIFFVIDFFIGAGSSVIGYSYAPPSVLFLSYIVVSSYKNVAVSWLRFCLHNVVPCFVCRASLYTSDTWILS